MPVNTITIVPTQQKETDPMTKIAQGLQIANSLMELPVNWQKWQLVKAQRSGEEMKLQTAQAKAGGQYTQQGLQDDKLIANPMAEYVRGGQKTPLQRFPRLEGRKLNVTQDDGTVKEGIYVPKEDVEKQEQALERQVDNYNKDDVGKVTRDMLGSVSKVLSALDKPGKTGISDVAGAYGFIKSLSPGIVTDKEFGLIENSGGLVNRFFNIENRLKSGKLLDSEANALRNEMKSVVRELMKSQLAIQSKRDESFGEAAERAGFQREDVVKPVPIPDKLKSLLEGTAKKAGAVSDKVQVQLPDGRTGSIPKAKLQEAIKQGAKVIDG